MRQTVVAALGHVAIALALAIASAPAAHANSSQPILSGGLPEGVRAMAGRSLHLEDGSFALSPIGFLQLCQEDPGACPEAQARRIVLDEGSYAQLTDVNRAVNRAIAPRREDDGADRWQSAASAGDCEDYALAKRARLVAGGWPAGVFSFAMVYTDGGEAHLVLTVRTTIGDLVLDNLNDDLRHWSRLPYRWVKRQSTVAQAYWVEVVAR